MDVPVQSKQMQVTGVLLMLHKACIWGFFYIYQNNTLQNREIQDEPSVLMAANC